MKTVFVNLPSVFGKILFFCFAFLMSTSAFAIQVDKQWGIQVELVERPTTGGGPYASTHIRILNQKQPRHLKIVVSSSGYGSGKNEMVANHEYNMDVGETVVDLISHQWGHQQSGKQVDFYVDGVFLPTLSLDYSRYHAGRMKPLLIIGESAAIDGAKLEEALKSGGARASVEVVSIKPENAFNRWQYYLGSAGHIVMLDSKAAGNLDESQKKALYLFVRIAEGNLWIYGENSKISAHLLGFKEGNGGKSGLGEIAFFDEFFINKKMLTRIKQNVSEKTELSSLVTQPGALFGYNPMRNTESLRQLFNNLHETPKVLLASVAFLLAVIIGPLNFVYWRRKRKPVLFYLATPLLAAIGMILIFGFSFLGEGLGVKSNECALMVHDQTKQEGAVYHLRTLFAGFSPGKPLKYPVSAAVIPFVRENNKHSTYQVDWRGGQLLMSGWVPGREVVSLFTISPGFPRFGVAASVNNQGRVQVTNGLPYLVKNVYVRLPVERFTDENSRRQYNSISGYVYLEAQNIAPGETTNLRQMHKTYASIGGSISLPFIDEEKVPWQVIAKTEYLPNLDNGGLSAKVFDTDYFYVGIH